MILWQSHRSPSVSVLGPAANPSTPPAPDVPRLEHIMLVVFAGCSSPEGRYARKRNPWVDFTNIPTLFVGPLVRPGDVPTVGRCFRRIPVVP